MEDGLSPRLRAFASDELAGERELWSGRPDPRWALLVTLPLWIFAIPWTAFALFWEWIAIGVLLFAPRVGEGLVWKTAFMTVAALFGLPFLAIGLAMLAAPFIEFDRQRRTVWLLTDKRILRLTDGAAVRVASWLVGDVEAVRRKERRDGSGTLALSFGYKLDGEGDRVEHVERLRGVPSVAALERHLRTLMAGAPRGRRLHL